MQVAKPAGGNVISDELNSSIRKFAKESSAPFKKDGTINERIVVVDRKTGKIIDDYRQEIVFNKESFINELKEGSQSSNKYLFNAKGEYHPDSSILHIHTHPTNQSFSDGDLRIFAKSFTIGEMRVITPNMEFSITKTKKFLDLPWQKRTAAVMDEVYNRNMAIVEAELKDMPGDDDYLDEVVNRLAKRIADEFKLKYKIKEW